MGTFCEVFATEMETQISRNNKVKGKYNNMTVCIDRLPGQPTVLTIIGEYGTDVPSISVGLSTESMRYLIDALQNALEERYDKSM